MNEPTEGKYDAAKTALHTAIGDAIAGWSVLEHSLAEALGVCLDLPVTRVRGMFFSARSFSGKHDMLLRAAQDCPADPKSALGLKLKIFRCALNRSNKYKTVRNHIAHDKPILAAKGMYVLGPAMIPNSLKITDNLPDQIITLEAIEESASRFRELADLVNRACSEGDDASLDTLLQQVRELPPSPYSDSHKPRSTEAP